MTQTRDNTLLLQQMHEVRLFQSQFKSLFAHIPAIVFSPNGHIKQINQAAENALGLTAGQIIGRTFKQVGCRVIDERGKPLQTRYHPWIMAYKKDTLLPNVITGIVNRTHTCLWQQSTSMPLIPSSGRKKRSVITIFTDITRYKQTQIQILQSQKMEAVGSLASGLAHDFNNILSSVRAAVQLILVNHPPGSRDYEGLKDIENESIRGAELVKQLLMFGKPSLAKAKSAGLNSSILGLKRLLRRTIPMNIGMDFRLAEHELAVRISPAHLEQVLLNLALNARDAMPEGGTLKIRTAHTVVKHATTGTAAADMQPGSYAEIEICDSGVGISPENLNRIFEPFFTSKMHNGGTGLGLAIVYSIVRQQNGYIFVESALGKGTKFMVYLPARLAGMADGKAVVSKVRPHGGTGTILVVDDEPVIAKSTAGFLQRYGYKTLVCYDGRQALELFKTQKDLIELVLLDLEMPELNGAACLEEMLKVKNDVKVITVSGHLLGQEEWTPVKAGAKMFIQKPYDSEYLLEAIHKVIHASHPRCGHNVQHCPGQFEIKPLITMPPSTQQDLIPAQP